jgi:hypothetical protein
MDKWAVTAAGTPRLTKFILLSLYFIKVDNNVLVANSQRSFCSGFRASVSGRNTAEPEITTWRYLWDQSLQVSRQAGICL